MTSPDERLQQIVRRWEREGPTAVSPGEVSYLVGALRDARAEVERQRLSVEWNEDIATEMVAEKDSLKAELAAERAKVQRQQARIDAANAQLNRAFSEGWRVDHVRAALSGEVSE